MDAQWLNFGPLPVGMPPPLADFGKLTSLLESGNAGASTQQVSALGSPEPGAQAKRKALDGCSHNRDVAPAGSSYDPGAAWPLKVSALAHPSCGRAGPSWDRIPCLKGAAGCCLV